MPDATWRLAVMMLQFILGLATFSIVYMLTGHGVAALTCAGIAMAVHTGYWAWEVRRD